MFNVFYETPQGTKTYCIFNMPQIEAQKQMVKFKARYLNADGTGKRFPNGKGYYQIWNVRVDRV